MNRSEVILELIAWQLKRMGNTLIASVMSLVPWAIRLLGEQHEMKTRHWEKCWELRNFKLKWTRLDLDSSIGISRYYFLTREKGLNLCCPIFSISNLTPRCLHLSFSTPFPFSPLSHFSFNVHGIIYVPDDGEMLPIEREIRDLAAGLQAIKDEQEYLVIRERVHRNSE